jgi:hypothetical protein
MFHPQIARNLQAAIAELLVIHDRVVERSLTCPPELIELYAATATTFRDMAEGYRRLLRHVQAVNGEPPADATAATPPAPTAPTAPAAAELAGARA